MKKKAIFLSFMAILAISISLSITQKNDASDLTDFAVSNIEALANTNPPPGLQIPPPPPCIGLYRDVSTRPNLEGGFGNVILQRVCTGTGCNPC